MPYVVRNLTGIGMWLVPFFPEKKTYLMAR